MRVPRSISSSTRSTDRYDLFVRVSDASNILNFGAADAEGVIGCGGDATGL